jgi:hypothetical protein
MSWLVEIRPQPIEATLIRLLGAFLPSTVAGTMVGKLKAIAVAMEAFVLSTKNFLLVTWFCFIAEVFKPSYN